MHHQRWLTKTRSCNRTKSSSLEGAGKPDICRRHTCCPVTRRPTIPRPISALDLSRAQPCRWDVVRCAGVVDSAGAPAGRPSTLPHIRRPGRSRSHKQMLSSAASASTLEGTAQTRPENPSTQLYCTACVWGAVQVTATPTTQRRHTPGLNEQHAALLLLAFPMLRRIPLKVLFCVGACVLRPVTQAGGDEICDHLLQLWMRRHVGRILALQVVSAVVEALHVLEGEVGATCCGASSCTSQFELPLNV